MKKVRQMLLLLTLLFTNNIYCQVYTLYGVVKDENKERLPGAYIKLNDGIMQTFSDMSGTFSFVLESDVTPNTIEVSFLGYEDQILTIEDTVTSPIQISLTPIDELDSQNYHTVSVHPHNDKNKFSCWQFREVFAFDMIYANFTEYEGILGNYNTDFMEQNGVFDFEFGLLRNKLDYGIGFGFIQSEDYNNDSLSVKSNTTQYSLKFGYNILNVKRFSITPKIVFKWKRYRLLNSSIERKIDIEDYIENRNIDIRFNQTYLAANIDFAYKLPIGGYSADNWLIGGYCGYVVPLNNTPWVYSKGNRLETDRNIRINNINWGIYFALTVE